MSNILAKQEQKARLLTEARRIVETAEAESNRAMTADEENTWQRYMADIDSLENEIKNFERKKVLDDKTAELRQLEPRKAAFAQSTPNLRSQTMNSKVERNNALRCWLGNGILPGITQEQRAKNDAVGLPITSSTVHMRSINTLTSGAGGAATFETWFPEGLAQLKYFSDLADRVDIQSTSDGNLFTFPRGSDIANMMSIVAQTSGNSEVDPTFDKVTVGAYLFRGVITVSYEQLEDSVYDIESFISAELMQRWGRTLEYYTMIGSGSSEPTGLVTAVLALNSGSPQYVIPSGSGYVTFTSFDQIMALFQSVDRAYRKDCTLCINDSTLWNIKKIKDSTGRYIWNDNMFLLQGGSPKTIDEFGYLVSNSVPADGSASTNIAVFAPLKLHTIRLVDTLKVRRLNELYASDGLIGIEFLARWDSNFRGFANSAAVAATPAS